MLATQLNEKVTSGELDTNCVIRLDKYICNPIQPDRSLSLLLFVETETEKNKDKMVI